MNKFLKKISLKHFFKKSNKISCEDVDRQVYEGETKLNILDSFPIFVANGWGLYPIRAKLTMLAINQVIPALSALSSSVEENEIFGAEIYQCYKDENRIKALLGEKFSLYGSDKATTHDYHDLYGSLLVEAGLVKKIFEIGLGTNNTDVVSTMGESGSPGASLRAFRDIYQSASVYGADYDRRILFEEERISTFFVDQTNVATFNELGEKIGSEFDLMIDDGLHAPNANLHSLAFFLPRIKVGGYAVIEDINPLAKDLWNIVSSLLSRNYLSAFLQTKAACVFVVKRIG